MNNCVKNSNNKKLFTKTLSIAALAGLTFLGVSANAQGVNVDDNSSLAFEEGQITGAAADLATVVRQNGDREYNFDSATDVYTATGTFGNMGSGKLTINGVVDENGNKSTIDMNGNYAINKSGNIELNNIVFKNAGNRSEGVFSKPGGSGSDITLTNVDFINNVAHSTWENINGAIFGAFEGRIRIHKIEGGLFKQNGAVHTGTNGAGAYGGALCLWNPNDYIKDINADFIENYTKAVSASADGGAIYVQYGTIGKISGNFDGNYVKSSGTYANGGAIFNVGKISDINGNFNDNYAQSLGTFALGGAIYNGDTISNITANFKNNHTESSGTWAQGGGIYNTGTINSIRGDFVNNYAQSTGVGASASGFGGAIENRGPIEKIQGNFQNNYTRSKIYVAFGGAIENRATISDIQGSFKNNYAETENKDYLALGGAVFTRADIQFSADKQTNEFTGNYTKDARGKKNNAIFVMTTNDSNPTITFNAKNNGSFLLNDSIEGGTLDADWKTFEYKNMYNLKLKGDSTGKVYINNDILNANIEHNDVTTFVDGMKYLNHAKGEGINSLTMNSGTLNVGSFNLAPLHFDSFGMNGGTINIDKVDVDLANKTMGRITANSYGGSDKGTINVKAMNVLSDGEKEITPVLFADKSFKNTVKSPVKEAYTKLYRYDVSYDANGKFGEDGYFVFTRGGGSSNPSDGFNPAVLTDSTAVQAGGQTAMNQVIKFAFEHADVFSQLPSTDRFAKINSNKYAIASTDFNSNLKYNGDLNNQGVWVKPYSTFENIKLKNGPKVNTINYGTLIGFDSDFHKLKHGWANVGTAYIGYSGSQMDYKGVDASMNSGLIGLTETFYKGNFWTALTATAGAGVAEAHTMYGKDDITMLMAGIGSKTGYNLEFKEGKFIVQPRLFMSYSFVNSFDYTNSAGVRIDSDPMHTVQINPSIRFIGNTKGGWQPYASVGMVWNLLNETHTEANGVKLPEMHTKPYIEYGVGLQRTWADKFSAYGQAMLRHGGRNGVALTFGFRWAIGKEVNDKQKVQKDSKMLGRQEVKRASKTLSHQNEPAAEGNRKVLKQLSPTQKQKLANTTTIVNNIYPQKARLQGTTRTAMNANVEKL